MTELMSDQRHEQLVKAAEDCIDLMNLGAHPDAALRHVKRAFDMNDNEVVLVSHAVNNSKQLAHLQTASDKTTPCVLTNADAVTGANSKADMDTPGDQAEAKAEQPDAVEIKDKVKKEAAAPSYTEEASYRKVAFDAQEAIATLRSSWGTPSADMPVTDLSNPYDGITQVKIAAEQARTTASRLRDASCSCLDKVAEALVTSGAPAFAEFEKVALAAGVTPELIDIIYEMGPAHLELPRLQEKVASEGRLYVSPAMGELLKKAESADALWQESADYEAARQHLQQQIDEFERKTAADVTQALQDLEKAPQVAESLLPLDPEKVTALGPAKAAPVDNVENLIDYKTKQQLQNTRARSQIESLMQDDFVGKHEIPEVVESYNRAMSVNPKFGDAEVMAFVRQDLASKNAIPLDLMIRASNAHQKTHAGGDA